MNLMQIIRTNHRAQKIISEMNLADIVKKYGVSFSDAKRLQHLASLLIMEAE